MPATMTHQLFAQTIINLHPRFKNITDDMFKVLMLATQGPDPFFFYGMHPFIKRQDKKRVQGIGSKLHHEDPAKNLKDLLDHAFNDVSKDKDIKVNYALGALMHYVLDRHVHGYVFSISGFDEDGHGNIRLYDLVDGTKVYVNRKAGRLDYENGIVEFLYDFDPEDTTFTISVIPESVDVLATRDMTKIYRHTLLPKQKILKC